jgi:hypothetical protein
VKTIWFLNSRFLRKQKINVKKKSKGVNPQLMMSAQGWSVSRVTGDRLYVPTACAKRVHMFKKVMLSWILSWNALKYNSLTNHSFGLTARLLSLSYDPKFSGSWVLTLQTLRRSRETYSWSNFLSGATSRNHFQTRSVKRDPIFIWKMLQETTIRKAKEWSHQADTKDAES